VNIREYQAAIDEATALHSKRIQEVHLDLRQAIIKITSEFIGNNIADEPEYRDEDRIRDAMTEAQDHPGRTITR
jgi:hypothetical protein